MRVKKLACTVLFILAVGFLLFPLTANAVVNWTKNPTAVLSSGTNPLTDYDAGGIERPMVIIDGTTYRMYYTGFGIASGVSEVRLLHASSSDGINWTPNHTTPILPLGGSGAFDENHNGFCWVIKDGTTYKMWYAGNNNADPEISNWQIGYATSSDGVTWVRYGDTPVLAKGSGSVWDSGGIAAPSVIKDGSIYKMWYTGWNTSAQYGFGYATSPDGMNWTKHPGNPVLLPGNPGSWDSKEGGMPSVIKEGYVYRMWYYGIQSVSIRDRIGYAYSYNGTSWTKYDGNPVLMNGQFGSFDESAAWDPVVVKDGNTYKMWYVGSGSCTMDGCWDRVGYAESDAYSGPNPVIGVANVYTQNTSNGKQIVFGIAPEGPGPLDVNKLYVTGPNGLFQIFTDSNLFNMVGQQLISGSSNVADFGPYAGTYTYTITANNGATATKQLTLTPTSILYPVDGTAQLDRRIDLGGNTYDADNAYISGTTPTFKWKPSVGQGYYYRVRVMDLKRMKLWFMSDPVLGNPLDAEGRMSATVPQGILQPNTPYQYEIEVLDNNDFWTAHNRSRSTAWKFYTGTKGTDFLFNPSILYVQSFRGGEQGIGGVNVYNLAPWDISSDTTPFRVESSGVSQIYFQYSGASNYQSLGYYQYAPADYSVGAIGKPDPVLWDCFIADIYNNWDMASRTFADVLVPQVTKNSMDPVDNSYLPTLQPTLTWKSEGPGFKYRARIHAWNNLPVWVSPWRNGAAAGNAMSETVTAGILQPGPYRWFVEVQDGDASNPDVGNNTRTRSQYLTMNLGGPTRTPFVAWGTDKGNLAVSFSNYGSNNGMWTYNGTTWQHPTTWIPSDMVAWGNSSLAITFSNYGNGNGLWIYNGTAWQHPTTWIPDKVVSWGTNTLAVSFSNYGTGNGLWVYDGTTWQQLSTWIPADLVAWGSSSLAVTFSNYGTGNGLWIYNGTTWQHPTTLIPDKVVSWGTDILAVSFSTYGADNGMWTFNGSTWQHPTTWIPADMVAWGNSSLTVTFSNYGTGNGLWTYNGTTWNHPTTWIPDKVVSWGTNNLAVSFSNYGADNGMWTYNGTSWTKPTNWVMDAGASWSSNSLALGFSNYGSGNGLWTYNGTVWNQPTTWIPGY